jgi:hypothetical protein
MSVAGLAQISSEASDGIASGALRFVVTSPRYLLKGVVLGLITKPAISGPTRTAIAGIARRPGWAYPSVAGRCALRSNARDLGQFEAVDGPCHLAGRC